MRIIVYLSMLLLLGVAGCATEAGSYHAAKVYPHTLYGEVARRCFEYEGVKRNPVILIHGLMGAELRDYANDGAVVWGRFSLWEMLSGGNFRALALPMRAGVPLDHQTGTVRPAAMLKRSVVELLWFRFHLDNYEPLVDILTDSGYVPEDMPLPPGKKFPSLFVFYYDWRQDIATNAARLHDFVLSRRKFLQARYESLYGLKDYDVQFDLIGHSMGGLVALYYARYGNQPLGTDENLLPRLNWAGSIHVDKIIQIGTPNAGYPDTLLELQDGLKLTGLAPRYPAEIMGSFVSYYQMLPDPALRQVVWSDDGTPVEDYLDTARWIWFGWGLARRDNDRELQRLLPELPTATERRGVALEHLEKCLRKARQFKRAMNRPGRPPADVKLYLFAGDGALTNHQLQVDRQTGRITVRNQDSGDGKVPSGNARFDLRDGGKWDFFINSPVRWDGVWFLPGSHMGIFESDFFASNLRFLLLAAPPPTASAAEVKGR